MEPTPSRQELEIEPTVPARGRRARGSALTEFALILPFLLTGIFGVIEFGRALYTYHFVSDAAREASRWASVRGNRCTVYPNACPANPSVDVPHYVRSIAPPGIDTSSVKLVVDSSWVKPPGDATACRNLGDPGCAVQVQVTYNFSFVLPFLPKGTFPMKSTSEMVISQ
jgi:Flp pilus assembly protein TadG